MSRAERRERGRLAQQRVRARKRGESIPLLRDISFGLTLEERFWSKVDQSGDCWLWTACLFQRGYGCFRMKHANVAAHRIAWELAFGPVPPGLWVLHHCDIRACVRPSHLFLGDHAANMADMVAKGRAKGGHPERFPQGELHVSKAHPELIPRGERVAAALLTELVVRDLRQQHAAARIGRQRVPRGWLTDTAARLGVTPGTVTNAIAGRTWGHVA